MSPSQASKGSNHNPSKPSVSTSSSHSINETTALLPHERALALESQPSSQTQHHSRHSATIRTHPLNAVLRLAPHHRLSSTSTASDDTHEPVAELQHILSRIDTIEIGLWQERVASSDAQELGLGERLSRVNTCVCSNLEIEGLGRKGSSAAGDEPVSPTTADGLHRYFWVDVAGVGLMGTLVFGLLLYVAVAIKDSGQGKRFCDQTPAFWSSVQMLISLVLGLLTQMPVKRWLLPFLLPLWVLGVLGTMVAIVRWGCKG